MAKRTNFVQLDLLDLLAEIEARPVVVRLPASHWGRTCWAAKLEIAADYLAEQEGKPQEKNIWIGVCLDVENTLSKAGATAEEVASELLRFRRALTAAVCRRGARHQQSGPGAASPRGGGGAA